MANHIFGGPDTAKKLRCLQEYLRAFSIALRNQQFSCVYVDAFAGSGTRTEVRPALPLFGPEHTEPEEITTPGSALIALETDPPLDSIVLIEQDAPRFSELEKLAADYPNRGIVLRKGDANTYVQRLCANTHWRKRKADRRGIRGVIFLDPYGMEVSWATVEAIAQTEALDCWYFFPLSGLYRNAPHDPAKLDASKQAALDRVLGATDWRHRWYQHEVLPNDIFETSIEAVRRADVDAIEVYVKERLQTAFKGAVLDPIRLHHRNGAPLASLFFAVSNTSEPAVRLATEIASYILNSGRLSHKRSR
ncbi:three-Cys-motif partner protein TcmP [Pseudaminobacter arsenicus]|uniref:Three-Cys-motif partner protein TcmP n=1 Tax=Borborobacter arsenicus TaxID=1851146 RepID=A0A432UZQ5_9HYPH|nr:three-Cys-motif partner protein TcmP [Pseudaminobacter arsenicus]RUM95328.1 three-Cys-motif partner protein TcmP [Pseudaminobacter arsenicus]